MRTPKNHPDVSISGFTIVELLIVIVIIAILATITIITYNGIQQRATDAGLASTLSQVDQSVMIGQAQSDTSSYGSSIPSNIPTSMTGSSSMPLHYYQRGSGTSFCADIYSTQYPSLQYYVDDTHTVPTKGLCSETPVPSGGGSEATPTPASCFTTSNVTGGVSITDYLSTCSKAVVIPSTISSKNVVTIGSGAFYNQGLTSVVIPSGVTSINDHAFGFNALTSVTIPNGVVTIGDWAFYNNQLTSVTIPSSVNTMGNDVFESNKLASVVIPSGITSIGSSLFYNNQLTSVTIPSSVNTINDHAFAENRLASVTIPNGVVTIGDWAFYNNQLTSVTIPSSVTSIGWYSFGSNTGTTTCRIPSSYAGDTSGTNCTTIIRY